MKEKVEIDKAIYKLRSLLVNSDDITKMDLYWEQIKECMDKDWENTNHMSELFSKYLSEKIEFIDKNKKRLIAV